VPAITTGARLPDDDVRDRHHGARTGFDDVEDEEDPHLLGTVACATRVDVVERRTAGLARAELHPDDPRVDKEADLRFGRDPEPRLCEDAIREDCRTDFDLAVTDWTDWDVEGIDSKLTPRRGSRAGRQRQRRRTAGRRLAGTRQIPKARVVQVERLQPRRLGTDDCER